MKRFIFTMLILAFLIPAVSQAQIKNPNIPRFWWSGLETFLRNLSEQPISFTVPARALTTTYDDTLAIFIPNYAMSIVQTNLNFGSINDPDSTSYLIMQTGSNTVSYDTIITIDSSGNGNTGAWSNTTSFNLAADSTYKFYIESILGNLSTGVKTLILHGRIR